MPTDFWGNAIFSLVPTVALGLVFWFVIRAIIRAACLPIWLAAAASPGVPGTTAASPATKTCGCPGIDRSGVTSARPARSTGIPIVLIRGEAALPAAQNTVRVAIRSSPM